MAHFPRIAVVGAGLIGGSVLLAAARRGLAGSLACWSRSEKSRETLRGLGVAEVCADPAECVRGADLVVVATPVDTAEETFRAIAPGLKPGAVVTDAGSVKAAILAAARALPSANPFVGAHPMAGGEKAGAVHASANLFEGRVCFVTPAPDTDARALELVRRFWRELGSVLHETDAAAHDEVVAAISHLPHAAASALMLAAAGRPGFRRFAVGAGLRDATRIAAGEENLWVGILLANAAHVAGGLRDLERRCAELREAVERGDAAAVRRLLAEARVARQQLDRPE
jgi:prephenate dehydrogenase